MRLRGAAVLLVFAAIAGQATAANSRVSSWLVFSAALDNGTEGQQLFRVRLDGSGLEQISFGRKIAQDPEFSPNGKRVVFTRLGEGLFVINVDGSGLRRLTPDGTDRAPAWSRDGQRITFLRSYKNAYRVYVMRADGKRQRRLFYAPAPAGRPSWTPAGRILVPAMASPNTPRLVEIGAGDGHVKKRFPFSLRTRSLEANPAISPNGRFVAWIDLRACQDCESWSLYLGSASGHSARRLADDTGPPSWSPDSTRLAYVQRGAIELQSASTGRVETLPADLERLALVPTGAPSWQPS